MKLVTHKSKNLLYRISSDSNTTVQFSTSYSVVTQTTADTASSLSFKLHGYNIKAQSYTYIFSGEVTSSTGVFTKTFTTPSTTGFDLIRFGLNGASIDTLCRCEMDLKPSTTYTFTCNFTNITQGSISWKDMMLVEGSTAGDYEPYSYNLLDKWQYPATNTVNEVTFTNNGDGSITADGIPPSSTFYIVATYNKIEGHKYLVSCTYNRIPFTGLKMETQSGSEQVNFNPDNIFTATSTENTKVYIDVYNDHIRPSVVIPQLYDLTLMYGAGKEPTTVDQFYADYPELKVAPLGFIGLKNLEISNKNIKRLRYATTTRNLFDINKFGGITSSISIDGNILLSTLPSDDHGDTFAFKCTISVKKNTNYIISVQDHSYDIVSCYVYTDELWGNRLSFGSFPLKFNSGDNESLVIGFYSIGSRRQPNVATWIQGPQIEEGSTVTSYVPYRYLDLGIIPSNSGYILNQYNNLSEELLEGNVEIDNVSYHIPDKTNILLNKVDGKTNKIVQLLDKSTVNCSSVNDWIGGTGSDTNLRVANGVVSLDGTLGSYSGVRTQDNKQIIKGHKYYISIWAMCSKNASNVLLPYTYGFSSSTSTLTANEWKNAEKIDTANVSDTTSIGVRYGSGESSEETVVWSAKKPQFFDLTAMYGFGNEPTTVDQFKKDYPQFFDEKLNGIWNVRTSGISTTGKNLFDISKWITSQYDVGNGTLVERLPNSAICQGNNGTSDGDGSYSNGWFRPMNNSPYSNQVHLKAGTYMLSADYTMIENSVVSTAQVSCHLYGDNNYPGNAFTSAPVGSTVKVKNTYTVEEGYYYPIFTLNSGKVKIENIQIELNSTATTYEPYQENKIDLLSTQTLNGINGVNDYIEVIDKGNGLYDLKKTKNIDSVDLGTLDWAADGANFSSSSISSVIKLPADNNSVGNYTCQKYVNVALNKSFVDGDFGVNSSGYLYFRNSAYTTAVAFKTAMNGVILYYQLKTPVITTIATNLTYNQVSAIRTNGGLLLVNDNNNQKYTQPNVTVKGNYQYKI